MTYKVPEELKYTKDHEWAQIDSDQIVIGITDFAQSALGDIVFVELPSQGANFSKGEPFGVVESIKSVSDLYSPLSGTVLEVNEALENGPELLNQDPYSNWIIKLKPDDNAELDSLMTSHDYQKLQS